MTVLEIPVQNIIIMGRSLGSGPAIYISSRYEIGFLVQISPFISIREVVKDTYGYQTSLLIKDSFDNVARIKRVNGKVLIIHGADDKIVMPKHAATLRSKSIFM